MMQTTFLDVHAASAAFDGMAQNYDATFTESMIGRAQRNVVWDVLQKAFREGDRVLELNCGTGEDALFLTNRGVSVLGCDASARMIEVAERRKSVEAPGSSLEFRVLRNEDVGTLRPATRFDGVVSNFSGLNCVADPSQVARKLTHLVKPGATMLICISTRICLWEIAWYAVRGNFKKAFRRFRGAMLAHLGEIAVPVWYPTVSAMRRSFAPWFRLRSFRAVGLFVPPSYVEPWVRKHKSVLARLETMDRIFAAWPVLRGMGDHVLLEFERTG
jgi:2-polyprenyl-3-methyl-5-hydroxy-6-metoxy-1,4-benzoquinol methylase